MGVSGGGDGGNTVDGSVGTIVWVRRRNGSWWPGRILGPNELSASHLMSPRSGTPVKLLGREDASVDWYNLEKSKRVKAFRCGEFDACIERAEASQGVPIKKREKYARREDAILHALELEKQQFGIKPHKLGTISNGTSNRNSSGHRRELHGFSSDIYTRDDEPRIHNKVSNNKSHLVSRKAILLGEEENKRNILHGSKGKSSKLSIWEENNDDSLPRMRGLHDFGLRISPPKKKFSQSFSWEDSLNSINAHVDTFNASPTSSSRSPLPFKRKRSQGGYSEDYLVKKRDRRRPLVQVLQNSVNLPVSNSFQPAFDPGGISVLGGRDRMSVIRRAKRSRCAYLSGDSNDSLDDNGHSSEEMPVTSAQLGIDTVGAHSSSGLGEETESDSSETDYLEPDAEEDGNLTDTTHTLMPVSENFGVPNSNDTPISHLKDRMMDASTDAGASKWHVKGKRNIRNLTKRPLNHYNCQGYGNWKYPFAWHEIKDHSRNPDTFLDSHLEQWDESDDDMGSVLIDVDIEVQKRSYQGEHVPWVSLSSKWNGGKPILGHPVQIEILEDGSTGHLVSRHDAVPPAFMRTAKRSVMYRTPRSKPKDHFQKKHLKKVSNSNQKTRTLSSLATEKLSRRSALLDGLIKPEGGVPLVACVPLKVVFSRILEAIGRG